MIANTRGGFLISQIRQIQNRIFEKLLKESGIEDFNGPQGRILYILWQEDDLPIRELAKRTSLAKTTLTSMLDRMEAQGHLQRSNDQTDRRQTRVTLTEKARELSSKYDEVTVKMNHIFYKGFSDDAITAFDDELDRVLANLRNWEDSSGRDDQE